MTATTLFYIIISIIVIKFIIDKILDALNAKHFNDKIPSELDDVYDEEEYTKSQAYKTTNYKFGILTSTFSLLLTLAFLFLDGFLLLLWRYHEQEFQGTDRSSRKVVRHALFCPGNTCFHHGTMEKRSESEETEPLLSET